MPDGKRGPSQCAPDGTLAFVHRIGALENTTHANGGGVLFPFEYCIGPTLMHPLLLVAEQATGYRYVGGGRMAAWAPLPDPRTHTHTHIRRKCFLPSARHLKERKKFNSTK